MLVPPISKARSTATKRRFARSIVRFLKPHGCSVRNRRETIWARSQLHDDEVARHLHKSKIWMDGNLRERDLVIIGFWTDWGYLNKIIGDALTDVAPSSITLVDQSLPEVLKEKAPTLWDIAHSGGVIFEHVQRSGATFLEELRTAFSERWLYRMKYSGRAALETELGETCERISQLQLESIESNLANALRM